MPSEAERVVPIKYVHSLIEQARAKKSVCRLEGQREILEQVALMLESLLPLAQAAAPSPASLDEAVRVVDRMTCGLCRIGIPSTVLSHINFGELYHDDEKYRFGYRFGPCTAKGRAIIDALSSKGLLK